MKCQTYSLEYFLCVKDLILLACLALQLCKEVMPMQFVASFMFLEFMVALLYTIHWACSALDTLRIILIPTELQLCILMTCSYGWNILRSL